MLPKSVFDVCIYNTIETAYPGLKEQGFCRKGVPVPRPRVLLYALEDGGTLDLYVHSLIRPRRRKTTQ